MITVDATNPAIKLTTLERLMKNEKHDAKMVNTAVFSTIIGGGGV